MVGAIIGGGLAVAGIVGGMLSKKQSPGADIDISGELAKIRGLFAEARKAAIADVNEEAALGRMKEAGGMAARGIYSSPASSNMFSLLERYRLKEVGRVSGQLAQQEAQTSAQLLSQLMGMKWEQAQLDAKINNENRAAFWSSLGGLGGALSGAGGGLSSLLGKPGGGATTGGGGGVAGFGPSPAGGHMAGSGFNPEK